MKTAILTLIVITIFTLLTDDVIAQQNMYYVKSQAGLNLRTGPGSNNTAVTLIPAGDKVNVLNQEGDWWQVEYGKKLGYVHSKYLTKDPNEAAIAKKVWDEKHKPPPKSTSAASSKSSSEPSRHTTDYEWGIGIRGGDPTGVSVKKYLGGNALELTVGTLPFDNNGISLFVHYLFHLPAQKIGKWDDIKGLDWYFGGGGQIKGFNGNVDIGADGTIGAEYLFQNMPISVFLDVIIYVELVDDPLNIDLDAGIGVRYNF